MPRSKKINLILSSITALILIGTFYVFNNGVAQTTTTSLKGYAWSENIGWISFSGDNREAAPSASYGVFMDNDTGYLSGYAWSEIIGWIKFGGLSDFPTGSGTFSQNAQIVSNKLIGWARTCAGTVNGDCSSMTNRTDGWDGWISLSGNNYGVSIANHKTFSGYAWGSDVIGWIDFTGVTLSSFPITINIQSDFSSVVKGTSAIISWSSTGADSCELTSTKTGFVPVSPDTSGSVSSGILTTDTTFTVECKNGGTIADAFTTISVITLPPRLHVTDDGEEIVWNAEDVIPNSCTLSGDQGIGLISTLPSGSIAADSMPAEITLTLECRTLDAGVASTSIVTILPTPKLICTPSQNYINRLTTWTATNSQGNVSNVTWSGENITEITTPGNTLEYVYTAVGPKILNARGTVTYRGVTPARTFISLCSTTTKMKSVTGSGGEF